MKRSRNYVFTINNWTTEDTDSLAKLARNAQVRCIMYGKEVASTGTPHLQGFVVFSSLKSEKQVRILIKGHVEVMKGRVDDNVTYCSKDGDVTVYGKVPVSKKEQGKMEKDRWTRALVAAKSGKFDEIDADIYFRHYSTMKKIADDNRPSPSPLDTLSNEWIYGPTGTGKSRETAEKYPHAYWKLLNKWWDGYNGEDVVVMEDMDPFNIKLGGDIKRWADHYPFRAEYKGGSKMIRPKKIIITSNYSPEEIWTDENTVLPIRRRFKITHKSKPFSTPPKTKTKKATLILN